MPLVLAHAGAGATWQALLVVISLGLAVVFLLAQVGKVSLESPDDLVLPLASVAIASSLAPLGDTVLSDWVGWAFPIGVVMLASIVLTVFSPLRAGLDQPLAYGAVAIAGLAAWFLHWPITVAWHPPVDLLPVADDVAVSITSLSDGDEVPAGVVEVTVTADGGSIGTELVDIGRITLDAEEGGYLAVAVDDEVVEPEVRESCSFDAPCDVVTFPITVEPGDHELSVEFRRADGASFVPLVTDRVSFTALD